MYIRSNRCSNTNVSDIPHFHEINKPISLLKENNL